MAINWSGIEGFREDMTPEERLELLENQENFGIIDPEAAKRKAQFDKVSSELAATKRQLKDRMTEDERKEAERELADKAVREELEALRRERNLNEYKAKLIAQGYAEEHATEFANGLLDGNTDAMFKTMQTVQKEAEKRMRAEILRDTPRPPAGGETDNLKTPDILMAERIGKAKADSMKSASNIMSMYTTGGK